MSNSTWSYDEFLCYVMIYVSHSDLQFSDDERTKIISGFGTEIYEKQFAAFNELSDFQALNVILEYKESYFATEDQKNALLEKIKSQYFVDSFSDFEKEIYHFLEKLF